MGVTTSVCTNSLGVLPPERLAYVNGWDLHTLLVESKKITDKNWTEEMFYSQYLTSEGFTLILLAPLCTLPEIVRYGPQFHIKRYLTKTRLGITCPYLLFWGYNLVSWCKRVCLCIPQPVLGGFGMILVGRHQLRSFPTSTVWYISMGYEPAVSLDPRMRKNNCWESSSHKSYHMCFQCPIVALAQ